MRRTVLGAILAPALMLMVACPSSPNGTTITVLGYTVTIKTAPPTTAPVGTSIPVAFMVTENESDGTSKPAAGKRFTVTVTAGGGTVNGAASATLTTAADGSVSLAWILGSAVGTQTVRGSVSSTQFLDVSVTATAPTIRLSATTATFSATVGGGNPPPQNTIQVTNSGTGSLTGLAVGPITYQAGLPATGWLTGGLTPSTAPGTLALAVTTGSLAAGTYTATVPITATAPGVTNSGVRITATLTVQASAGVSFIDISAGTTQTCGRTQAGAVYCWGGNPAGQLGDGTTTNRLVPTLVHSP